MVKQDRTSPFVSITCPCGRDLRAKLDQVGTEIRCWDCHKLVFVPLPNQGQRVARELSDGAMVVIKGPGLLSVIVAAAILTAIMAIPPYGPWCSVIAFTLAASVYGEMICRVSRGASDEPDPSWRATLIPRSLVKLILCMLMALGTVVPLWILNSGEKQSPHLDVAGRSILSAAWMVLPLLMLISYGRDGDRPLGIEGTLRRLLRHPLATILALAVVPILMAFLEASLALILYIPGNLPFFALDYMPMPLLPDSPAMIEGIPYYNGIDYRSYPGSKFVSAYFDGLRHGYSFVGAIPTSLSHSSRAGMNPMAIGLFMTAYFIARIFIVYIVLLCLLTAFAIQARWLGAIPSLDRRRSADSVDVG